MLSLVVSILCSFFITNQVSGDIYAEVIVAQAKVRSCPGLSCNQVFSLPMGAKIKVLEGYHIEKVKYYGEYRWYRIRFKSQEGYIFGGLIKTSKDLKVPIKLTAYAAEDIQLMQSESLDVGVMAILPKGKYYSILPSGADGWYTLDYHNSNKILSGFVKSKDLVVSSNYLIVNFPSKNIFDEPNGRVINQVKRGEFLKLVGRQVKSELIRPLGRYYWYKVENNNVRGWIYGAGTTKEHDPVDCQCVDYLKQELNIVGATRNAFQWYEILLGHQEVEIDRKMVRLNYKEVGIPLKGDIAVFSNSHSQANSKYGHVGYINQVDLDSLSGNKVLILGANHKAPYHNPKRIAHCNNVSLKWYNVTKQVRFFRQSQ